MAAAPPASQSGTNTALSVICHLGMLAFAIVVPLIVHLTIGKDDPDVRHHAEDDDRFVVMRLLPRWLLTLLRSVDRRVPPRLRQLVRRSADRDLLTSASSLAFYGLVSALPILLIAFALINAVAGGDTLRQVTDQVARSGPEGTGRFLDSLVAGGRSLSVVTVIFAIWPATAYAGGCVGS